MKKWMFLVMLIFVLGACSSGEQDESMGEEAGTYPLTGIETEGGADNRMVAIMINNSVEARPQTGLNEADIIFEVLTEGNVTRLMALYQSQYPEVVGPIRSAREYYFNLAEDYDAIYVYHGAADVVNDMIQDSKVEFLNGTVYDDDGHLFKRESSREAPHNSYLQFSAVPNIAEEKGYAMTADYSPLPFLSEEEQGSIEGEAASRVEVNYSNNPQETITYVYDEAEEVYHRFIGEQQTMDMETEEPVQLENVFILETAHEVIDDEGRRAVDFSTGGNAYLLQQGKLQQLEWMNDNGRIVPAKDGSPVGLMPGKTWMNVIPTRPGLDAATAVQE